MLRTILTSLFLLALFISGCTRQPGMPSPPAVTPVTVPARPAESATVPPTPLVTRSASAQPIASAYPAPGATLPDAYPAPSSFARERWIADGAIADGEYDGKATIGSVTLWWRNDDQFLYLAAEANTTGWVAVGLDPADRMMGANYLQGWFDGQARMQDQFGTAPVGPNHPDDTTIGGTNDIVAFAVVEKSGTTRWEAQLPLDSGDAKDKPLRPGGTYTVITAVGVSDAVQAPHASASSGRITLSTQP